MSDNPCTDGGEWRDIEEVEVLDWDYPEYLVRDASGEIQALAKYSFEEETWDDVWFSWKNQDDSALGFQPAQYFKPVVP